MESSGLDQNFTNLVQILECLEQDLRIPYSESRPRFDEDLSLQIHHALNEIQNREKDLKNLIGISKIIQSFNKSIQEKSDFFETEARNLAEKLKIVNEELTKSKVFEEKFYETSLELKNTEKELNYISTEYRSVIKERNKKNSHMSFDSISLDRFSAEINEMNQKFKEELDFVTSNLYTESKIEAEKRNKDLEIQLHRQSVKLGRYRKAKNLEVALSTDGESLERSRCSLQVPIGSLKLEVDKYQSLRHSMRNPSELDSFQSLQPASPKLSESIKSEVDSFDNEIIKSAIFSSTSLDIYHGDSVEVKAAGQRRFTEQIYFCMTLNVVKLNNEHLSGINVDSSELYEEVVKKDVPLHKWIYWIESQLNMIHIKKNAQKGNSKTKRIN